MVQQINNQTEHPQTIHTNVIVTSVKTQYGSSTTSSPQSSSIQTSFECKQEPCDESQCLGNQSNPNVSSNNISDNIISTLNLDPELIQTVLDNLEQEDFKELDDFEDAPLDKELIQTILDNLEQEDCKELNDFEDTYLDKENRGEENNDSLNMFPPLTATSPSLSPKGPPFVDTPPPGANPLNPIYDTNQNTSRVCTPASTLRFSTSGWYSPSDVLCDTSPASKAPNQMASQYQNQNCAINFPVLGDFLNTGSDFDQFIQKNKYAADYSSGPLDLFGQNYIYGQQSPPHLNRLWGQQVPPDYQELYPEKADLALSFGATKPLSHYSHPVKMQVTSAQGDPSSSYFQQSQDLSREHFYPIFMHQQQSISPNYGAMTQHLMQEKHANQATKPRDSLLEQQGTTGVQPYPPPIQQYMGQCPPPKYKLQTTSNDRTSFRVNWTNNFGTIQNMISQANNPIQPGYSKSANTIQQMSTFVMSSTNSTQPPVTNYTSPSLTRYSPYTTRATTPMDSSLSSDQCPLTPTYKSLIMRNQQQDLT